MSWPAALAAALALAPVAEAAVIYGDCFLESAHQPDLFRLTLIRHDVIVNSRRTVLLPRPEIGGVSASGRQSDGAVSRREIVRAAGTLTCDGLTRNGIDEGRFHFVENRAYVAALRSRITNWHESGGILELFLADVPSWYAQQLAVQPAPALSAFQLAHLYAGGAHRDPPTSISRPAAPSPDSARLRAAGVSAEYWRRLRQTGYALFVEDAIRLGSYGVSPDMLREMKRAGHDGLSVSDMLRLQSHGVTEHDIRLFGARRPGTLTVDDIVRWKVNGVD